LLAIYTQLVALQLVSDQLELPSHSSVLTAPSLKANAFPKSRLVVIAVLGMKPVREAILIERDDYGLKLDCGGSTCCLSGALVQLYLVVLISPVAQESR
jgi:hypothetical protein